MAERLPVLFRTRRGRRVLWMIHGAAVLAYVQIAVWLAWGVL